MVLLGSIALSFVTYFILRAFPQEIEQIFAESIVAPVFNKITSVIAAIATPLVFLSVIDPSCA